MGKVMEGEKAGGGALKIQGGWTLLIRLLSDHTE